jgi:hypothetical protein
MTDASNKTLYELAQQWRANHRHHGGVVIIYNGIVQGWVDDLRNPEHWRAGCIAIDDAGRQWRATGGDYLSGAEQWCEQ